MSKPREYRDAVLPHPYESIGFNGAISFRDDWYGLADSCIPPAANRMILGRRDQVRRPRPTSINVEPRLVALHFAGYDR
jgi:hypothetical protein